MNTLIIDNYDSFTYNLYQMVAMITGYEPLVVQNDTMKWEAIQALDVDRIIISPGPGHPDNLADFGICREILLSTDKPVLGVCLGHQGLVSAYGGTITHAPQPMHGRISRIQHHRDDLFQYTPEQFNVVRYHSLIAQQHTLPDCLQIIAQTVDDQLIMGVRHRSKPLWGIQFHPESICSEYGEQLLRNFLT